MFWFLGNTFRNLTSVDLSLLKMIILTVIIYRKITFIVNLLHLLFEIVNNFHYI